MPCHIPEYFRKSAWEYGVATHLRYTTTITPLNGGVIFPIRFLQDPKRLCTWSQWVIMAQEQGESYPDAKPVQGPHVSHSGNSELKGFVVGNLNKPLWCYPQCQKFACVATCSTRSETDDMAMRRRVEGWLQCRLIDLDDNVAGYGGCSV